MLQSDFLAGASSFFGDAATCWLEKGRPTAPIGCF